MGDSFQLRLANLDKTIRLQQPSQEAAHLFSLLPTKGRLTQKALADAMDTNAGRVRRLIRELRRCGYPACSDQQGCWKTMNRHEIAQTIKNLQGRALDMLKTAAALRKFNLRG